MTVEKTTLAELIETLDDPARKVARETHRALLNRMEVKAQNSPDLAFNYRARKYNQKLWTEIVGKIKGTFAQRDAYLKQMRKTRKIKGKVSKTTPPIITRLHKAREKLAGKGAKGLATLSERPGRKTPDEWQRDIGAISDPKVRSQVACLVWWDFFATRDRDNGRKYWDHLDEFMDEYVDGVPAKDIAYGLMQIGYHPYDAAARSIGGDIRS